MSSPKMTFHLAAQQLPLEVFVSVLRYWIGPQDFSTTVDASMKSYTLDYANAEHLDNLLPTQLLPEEFIGEYLRCRHHSFKTDLKEFSQPWDYYMAHLLLSLDPNNNLAEYTALPTQWTGITNSPYLSVNMAAHLASLRSGARLNNLTGVEKIRLDFTAQQYFALFGVIIPPFDYSLPTLETEDTYPDVLVHNAASFLTQTTHLTLNFGTAFKASHPWFDIENPFWHVENPNYPYSEARLRPHVCDSGAIVDWILEFAWYNGYLQHIACITIEGSVQDWVKRKWQSIFTRHVAYAKTQRELGEEVDKHGVHLPDVLGIEQEAKIVYGDDAAYEGHGNGTADPNMDQTDIFPPACGCKIGCWRITDEGGVVDEQTIITSWEDLGGSCAVEAQTEGDWMQSVELGPVV